MAATNYITRAQFDLLRSTAEPMPDVALLLEPSGKMRNLFLTPGQTAIPTNPRCDREVRLAIIALAHLTEVECLNCENPYDAPEELGDLIDAGHAFQIEHADALNNLVAARIAQLAAWTPCPNGEPMAEYTKPLVLQTLHVLTFLRARGF